MSSIPSGVKALTDFFDKYSVSGISTLFGENNHQEDSFTDMIEKMLKESFRRNGIWNDTPVEVEYQSHWVNIFNTSKVEAKTFIFSV